MRVVFRPIEGERPALQDDVLPDNGASEAINCRFLSGNLESWLDLAEREGIVKEGSINSIFLMTGGYWLHWTDDELGDYATNVDVARGPLPGDVDQYVILTGLDAPRWTTLPLATTNPPDVSTPLDHPPIGATGEYPYVTFLLGVPPPDTAPELAVSQADTGGNITLTNPGAEIGISGWTVDTGDLSAVLESAGPLTAHGGTHYFAGVSTVALTEAHQDLTMATVGIAPLQGVSLSWFRANASGGGLTSMGIQFLDAGSVLIPGAEVFSTPFEDAPLTWTQGSLSTVAPSNAIKIRLVQRLEQADNADPLVATTMGFIDDIELSTTAYTANFDGTTLSGWSILGDVSSTNGQGRPVPSFTFDPNADDTAAMWRLAGTQNSPLITLQIDIYLEQQEFYGEFGLLPFCTATGLGAGIALNRESNAACTVLNWTSWDNFDRTLIFNAMPGSDTEELKNKWVRLTLKCERSATNTSHITFSLVGLDNGVTYVDNAETDVPIDGDYIGLRFSTRDNQNNAWADNLSYTVAPAPPTAGGTPNLRNYVTTFVNVKGQEGPPSPTSRDIQGGINTVVTLTPDVTPETPSPPPPGDPPGWGIDRYRIYRAVTFIDPNGVTVTDYYLVTEQPLTVLTFVDDLSDEQITSDGETLQTVDWDLPQREGEGALPLPNGVTCMFQGKEWAPSVTNHPHAYPLQYRKYTESEIVAQAGIDTSAVVWTRTRPYMVMGSDPARMSLSRFEHEYGLSAKRSIASLANYGVLGSCPVGLVAITGPGRAEIVSKGYFEQREWLALDPTSIIGVAHDDRYFFSWRVDDETKGAYCFDPRKGGNGLTQITPWFKVAFTDPETDYLYFIDEDDGLLQWEGGTELRPKSWTSKLWVLAQATNFTVCQVKAKSYPVDLTLYEDGTQFYTRTVTSEREFTVKAKSVERLRAQLVGDPAVEEVQLAESIEELR